MVNERENREGEFFMFEYKFELIPMSALSGKPKVDYEAVIEDYARNGWRLHTFAPLPVLHGGQALNIQLIFERPNKG